MVKSLTKNGQKLHQCESCGFNYSDRSLARKCEKWCREHNSCSLEITKHAVV